MKNVSNLILGQLDDYQCFCLLFKLKLLDKRCTWNVYKIKTDALPNELTWCIYLLPRSSGLTIVNTRRGGFVMVDLSNTINTMLNCG